MYICSAHEAQKIDSETAQTLRLCPRVRIKHGEDLYILQVDIRAYITCNILPDPAVSLIYLINIMSYVHWAKTLDAKTLAPCTDFLESIAQMKMFLFLENFFSAVAVFVACKNIKWQVTFTKTHRRNC